MSGQIDLRQRIRENSGTFRVLELHDTTSSWGGVRRTETAADMMQSAHRCTHTLFTEGRFPAAVVEAVGTVAVVESC